MVALEFGQRQMPEIQVLARHDMWVAWIRTARMLIAVPWKGDVPAAASINIFRDVQAHSANRENPA
jgi:hypothetical protein